MEKISGDDGTCLQYEMDQLQKEYEVHKQTHDQLYTSYQALQRHYAVKEEEINKLKSQCSELQCTVEEQKDELLRTKREMSMLKSDQVPGNEHDAELTQLRTSHALLIQGKDSVIAALVAEKQDVEKNFSKKINSKDIEIAELKSEKKLLESRLAHKHANITPTAPCIGGGGNKDAELLQGCTSETASPTTSTSAFIAATPEGMSLMEKEKERNNDAGVGSHSAEHIHSGVS